MATAQQLTDLAAGLAERGHQVSVIASRRGYDDAARRFAGRERWKNIEIIRVPAIDAARIPTGRKLDREDLAAALWYLTSPPASQLTGAVLNLGGGFGM